MIISTPRHDRRSCRHTSWISKPDRVFILSYNSEITTTSILLLHIYLLVVLTSTPLLQSALRCSSSIRVTSRPVTDSAGPPELHRIGTTCSPEVVLFLLDIFGGSLRARNVFVSEHQQWRGVPIVCVKIFQSPCCRLGVQEVDEWNEGEIEDDPNDVESPAETLNTNRCDYSMLADESRSKEVKPAYFLPQ